jgi:hypothetical protein
MSGIKSPRMTTDERRKAPRAKCVLDGTWSGVSIGGSVRISDVSATGCFIETLATPQRGERVRVQLQLPQGPLSVNAEVTNVEPRMGFGARFLDIDADTADILAKAVALLTRATS